MYKHILKFFNFSDIKKKTIYTQDLTPKKTIPFVPRMVIMKRLVVNYMVVNLSGLPIMNFSHAVILGS